MNKNARTDNEAVWRNGGSIPLKVQCKFGSLPPAGSAVEAATTPSRWDVVCNPKKRQCVINERKNTEKTKYFTDSFVNQENMSIFGQNFVNTNKSQEDEYNNIWRDH